MKGKASNTARGFWPRHLHQWHWVSAAICIVGMLLFAATGITLNHAGQIEARPKVTTTEAQVAAVLVAKMGTRPQKDKMTMPVDGISSATHVPGERRLDFGSAQGPLKDLPPGEYHLTVEAAREVGGREIPTTPAQWPPKTAQTAEAKGEHELGLAKISTRP